MCEVGVGKHSELLIEVDIIGIELFLVVRGAHGIEMVEEL